MSGNLRKPLILLVLTLVVGVLARSTSDRERSVNSNRVAQSVQERLTERQSEIMGLLNGADTSRSTFRTLQNHWKHERIGVFYYHNRTLRHWNTNAIPIEPSFSERNSPEDGIARIGNAWYLCQTRSTEGGLLVAYALLRTDLNFENRYLKSGWSEHFAPPLGAELTLTELNTFPLKVNGAESPVRLRITDMPNESSPEWSLFFWAVFLVLAMWFLRSVAERLSETVGTVSAELFFGSALIIGRVMMLFLQQPNAVYGFALFNPQHHASSFLIPSLGDLLLHVLVMLVVIWYACREMAGRKLNHRQPIATVLGVLLIWPVHVLIRSLVTNSSFSLQLTDPFSLSAYSLVALMIIAMTILTHYRVVTAFWNGSSRPSRSIWLAWLMSTALLVLLFYASEGSELRAIASSLAVLTMLLLRGKRSGIGSPMRYAPVVLAYTLITGLLLFHQVTLNEREERKNLAQKLEKQEDPITEYLFSQLEQRIRSDRRLRLLLSSNRTDNEQLLAAIRAPFNYDHWNRYRTQVHVYTENDSLLASDLKGSAPNAPSMQELFSSSRPTLSKDLHYLEKSDRYGEYLARIHLTGRRSQPDHIIFIRLTPEKQEDVLGFSDLFLDEGISTSADFSGYAYALYTDSALQERHGDYPYTLNAGFYDRFSKPFTFVTRNGYDHLIYRHSADRIAVVSRPERSLLDQFTGFSYLFLFFFLLSSTSVLVSHQRLRHVILSRSFRNRIHLAMVSVMLLSMVVIGAITVYHVMDGYDKRNREMIAERINSVMKAMERALHEPEDAQQLTDVISRLGTVFFTDINVYSTDGKLLGTTRPRLFDEGLIGPFMDPEAFVQMNRAKRSVFIQQETIGELDYLTSYAPFRNAEGTISAYVSLPYFARQSDLQQEIFTLMAALVNVYVFLMLLALFMAYIISNRITEPLRIIRDNLRELKLDRTNRSIDWKSDDEIGQLVQEYNRTVNELVRSAELLARSERESAWREMAKQVAHEIKNPLTPMKLSIQMLQRSMKDGADDLGERIDRMSETLIDQIDTLSHIATEFSSFAKMPKPNIAQVNLKELLESAVDLHRNAKATISLNIEPDEACYVLADREQMLRVFNNLIKNGIQAAPDDRQPAIHIGLVRNGANWTVSIKDNGTGIPDELHEKIFVPNFTTKSSGMGLGLAMVKNIIESVDGTISFDSEQNMGTTFYVSLPANDIEQ